jgi:plasmid stabilization system protein ParE
MFDKEKYKISSQNARIQLEKMFDYYEIDIDEIEDKELKRAIKGGYERLVKAIRLGRLEINLEDGIKIIQTTRNSGTKITYREIDGVAKSAMAGKEEKDYYGKSYALMGSLCDLGEAAIKKLKGVDLSLVEVLGMIFLSV